MEEEIQKILKIKKWYKRKFFYIILVIFLLAGGLVFAKTQKNRQEPKYETTKVAMGNLIQTVDATGNVQSADELDLKFEASGRIGKILKKIDEHVKAGEIIAELDLKELNGRLAQASAGVSRAKANLDKVLAGQTSEYKMNLKAKLDQAEANLAQIKASANDVISNAQAVLDTAEYNLKLSEGGDNSQILEDAYNNMVAFLISTQGIVNSALIQADNVLGVDNFSANGNFSDILSKQDIGKLSLAKVRYGLAKEDKIDFDEVVNKITIDSNPDEIFTVTESAEKVLTSLKNLLVTVSETLEATRSSDSFSQASLDTLKTNILTSRSNISTQYSSLITEKQDIENAKNSYDINLIAFNKAKASLENTIQKSSADILAYQAMVDQARAIYNEATNPPRSEDVASAQASLLEAQAGLTQAFANINKAKIIAPIDGVIGKIEGRVGEFVTSQNQVVKLINPHFEIKVDIPETDIIKINNGGLAEITIDAFGDDVKFKGVVIEIQKGETIIQDVVYYNVTLSLEDDIEHQILNGMTANVIFKTEEKSNVLYIPVRAIISNNGEKKVKILENNQVKEVNVKTGLRGDGGLVEITDGLKEGEDIILSVIETNKK